MIEDYEKLGIDPFIEITGPIAKAINENNTLDKLEYGWWSLPPEVEREPETEEHPIQIKFTRLDKL